MGPLWRVYRPPEGGAGDQPLQLEAAVTVFHQRGAAFDPVAVVAVQHAVDGADLRLVDVTADDAVEAAPAGLMGGGIFEGVDGGAGVPNPVFDVVGE